MTAKDLKKMIDDNIKKIKNERIMNSLLKASDIMQNIIIIEEGENCTKENIKPYICSLIKSLSCLYKTDKEERILLNLQINAYKYMRSLT